ncbi:MAG: zinc metallopeptidase, partial [Anaerococcus prevotii]|nr:zinc metallopeptidase [Anaerococcus prevotii]
KLAFPVILLGIFLSQQRLLDLGLILFSLALIFQLVTLPVEFDASRRAIRVIDESGMLYGEELDGAKAMLKAAAFTYVAATLATALQLLRLFLLYGNRNNRRD